MAATSRYRAACWTPRRPTSRASGSAWPPARATMRTAGWYRATTRA
ncbi:Uncharacterised protein [Bordetella pertussis]|nr:Uncharacterised protein [Bordetella pertussis]